MNIRGDCLDALQINKPGDIQIIEVKDYDEPNNDEVIIKVKTAGICGSDLHIYNGSSGFAKYPNIIGHEIAGEVVQVGEGVSELKAGDKVAVNNVISCGTCFACKSGRSNVCRDVKVLGVHVDGGYREFLKVNQEKAYKVPHHIPWDHAALVEPYSIAAQVLERGRLSENDSVLICGAGPIGLITLQAVKQLDVKVAVLDIVDSRLQKAKEFGADLIINSKEVSVKDKIKEFTDNEGASLIIESTGSIAVLEDCVRDLASQAGRIVVLGFSKEEAKISPYDIMRRELDIIGTRLNNEQFPTAIKWISEGAVNPEGIISHRYPYKEVKQAFDFTNDYPHKVLKIVLNF